MAASRETSGSATEFGRLAGACLQRFLAQNRCAPLSESDLSAYVGSLWRVVQDEGLPPPLAEHEDGKAGEMPAPRAEALVRRVLESLPGLGRAEEIDTVTRQLIKACLQPPFRQCRESYRAVAAGACRRQELARAVARVSGSHCVDCPYWLEFEAPEHAGFLAAAWRSGRPRELEEHLEVFLPEDFRRLRKHLSQEVRS